MTHLKVPAWRAFGAGEAFWCGEPFGAGCWYVKMGHELGVSWDLVFWLHTLVFLDPGPGLGGWVRPLVNG